MHHFAAYLTLARVEEVDREKLPGGLQVIVVRTAPPPRKPEAGIVFIGAASLNAFCRILEALWLDRKFVPRPRTERKLFLLGDAVYLQIGLGDITKVGESGPIRGAIEGFRSYLGDLLQRLQSVDAVLIDTPLGMREARYLEVELPDPAEPPAG